MKNKFIYIPIVVVILSLLSGILFILSKEDTTVYENCIDKISTEIDYLEINHYIIESKNLEYIQDSYGTECLRELDKIIYSIHRTENGSLLYLFYDKQNNNSIVELFLSNRDIDDEWIDYIKENETSINDVLQKLPDFKLFDYDLVEYPYGYLYTLGGVKYKVNFELKDSTLKILEVISESSALFDQVLDIDKIS
jgi:hypothetical protein